MPIGVLSSYIYVRERKRKKEAGIIQEKKQQWAITPLLLILYYCTILKRIRKECACSSQLVPSNTNLPI